MRTAPLKTAASQASAAGLVAGNKTTAAKPAAAAKSAAPAKGAAAAKQTIDQTLATEDAAAPKVDLGETMASDGAAVPAKAAAAGVRPSSATKPGPAAKAKMPVKPSLDQTVATEDATAAKADLGETVAPDEAPVSRKAPSAASRPGAAAAKKTNPPPSGSSTQAPPSKPARRPDPMEKTAPEPPADAPIGATGEWQAPGDSGKEPEDRTAVWDEDDSAKKKAPTRIAKAKKGTQAKPRDATEPGEDDATDFETDDTPDNMPESLGGYELVKQLGQGGMGTVYLARQVSLDRPVALKVMKPEWANQPTFLARFTREAYAAAQLVHHHIVQIYDIGAEVDVPFFSMEFVKGKHLGEVMEGQGPLDVEVAVGYVLQAARGLKFAHDQGMVHRDIKPDNLMLNDQGLVKVADLGLVKTPGAIAAEDQVGTEVGEAPAAKPGSSSTGSKLSQVSNVTAIGVAMGTPAYMAPEQGRNAAQVDHRADIYSLGCTLYVLLTGRPPFQGKTAMEVITKHFTEPIVRPEVLVKRVPKEVSDLLMKMMAKKPEDRHQEMGEVIADLENFLGIQRTGPFTPREEHANLLEECVKGYNAVPAVRLRKMTAMGFFGACVLALFIAALCRFPVVAGGFLGLAVMTTLFTFVINGMTFKTYLFQKFRELVFSSSWTDWLTWTVSLLLALLVLYLVGLFVAWLAFLVLALLLAGAFHFLVERKVLAQRQPALEKAEGLLRTMRLGGLEEDAIRLFVCKYGGDHWEILYESLFGYEFLLQARQSWAKSGIGKRRPHHAAWRDPIVAWIENRQKTVKEAREKKHLLKIEQKQLEAQGLKAAEAKAKAAQVAEALVEQGAAIKQQAEELRAEAAEEPDRERPKTTAEKKAVKRMSVKAMLENASTAPTRAVPRRPLLPVLIKSLRNLFFGLRTRFLLGAILVGLGLLWLRLDNRDLANKVEDLITRFQWPAEWNMNSTKPLSFFHMPPEAIANSLLNSFNPAAAGFLLLLSTCFMSRKAIGGLYLGGLVIFLGQIILTQSGYATIDEETGRALVDIPMWGKVAADQVSLAAGTVLAVLGVGLSILLDKVTE